MYRSLHNVKVVKIFPNFKFFLGIYKKLPKTLPIYSIRTKFSKHYFILKSFSKQKIVFKISFQTGIKS